ncbi:hypothetical protein FLL45_14450 [Aliikangiella marina]|uniref:PDZ domain-containing protein n=1 Tax=Aliikangiella marina TaxID=1712262 RepID=A0A545TA23_9GAMM|nr:trypsin-like peptidase domain-containing protein [Aliikangiella marina]TQV74055.1 hypothetical protein FLL45_14450 [Aliikangiella marina]
MFKKAITLYLLALFAHSLSASESPQWKKTIEDLANSVVSIRVNAVRTFDTEGSKTTQATGFIVDAERGIILTNRHVVHPGPITAEAVFSNSEEIELKPIYRDPVHDFGFFRFNPNDLQFIKPRALKLNAKSAKVGDDIRVIGNDSGEHMSILSGTLARLDRSAPRYRRGGYNDFNTFYYQSSADTSGGSSGAPVVNIKGEVVALNAGGNTRSSSSFFLPLYKVTRALEAIQKGQPIARGTIQTTLSYQPYDQVRRLGLPESFEKAFRDKGNGNGLLTVERTVFEGPAYEKLRPGDIIISVKSAAQAIDYVSRYEVFEIFLDEHVGKTIELKVLRQGKAMTIELAVDDLHQITPDEFVQLAGGIFNDFSYQIARQTNLSAKGVYIASPGFMFGNAGIGRGVVIQGINESKVDNLADFVNALKPLKQNQYFKIKYVSIGSPNNQQIGNVKFISNLHHSQKCLRNDSLGIWECEPLEWNQSFESFPPTEVKFTNFSDKQTAKIARSLVMVNADLPYHIDGQNYDHYSGTGLVLDADNGLVLVDRNTVPIKLVDVTINVSGIAEIPAEVLFVHPVHSYALLKYDPMLLPGKPLRSAPLSSKELSAGDSAWLVGYQATDRIISERVKVSSVEPLELPLPNVPQFRDSNINSILINNPPSVASGVLIDKRGKVRSWWTNYAYSNSTSQTIDRGLPIKHIIDIRDQWAENQAVEVYSLEVELRPITIASARNFGLSDEWMEQLQDSNKKPQALRITRRVAGSEAFDKLKDGDLLLAIDNSPIRDFNELEDAIEKDRVKVSVWRDGKQQDFLVATKKLTETDTLNFYLWSGALIQKPHRAVAAQYGIEPKGVYISWYYFGSPANRYNLRPLMRITEFEGEKVTDLEQFIALSQKHSDKLYVRIRMLDLIGRESIITLKQDLRYWPTQKIFWDGKTWHNRLMGT